MKIKKNLITRICSPPVSILHDLLALIITNKMRNYLIIFLFLFISCKKGEIQYDVSCNAPTSDITISNSLIVGDWIWVSELYRDQMTGQYILKTPQTEGYTRQLAASKNILEFYKNKAFEQKYRFEFVIESSITNYPDDSLNVLVFKDYNSGIRTNHTHFMICNDTLTLNFQVLSSFKGIEKWAKLK